MKPSLARRAEEVLKEAKARRLTLATVESCTAGSLGLLLADAPGAAEVLSRRFHRLHQGQQDGCSWRPGSADRGPYRRQPRGRRSDGPRRHRPLSG